MNSFTLPVVSDTTFKDKTINIDGKRFERCKFMGCTIIFSGLAPAEASACEFSGETKWGFENPAGNVLQTLQRFGWRFEYGASGSPAPIEIPVPKP